MADTVKKVLVDSYDEISLIPKETKNQIEGALKRHVTEVEL